MRIIYIGTVHHKIQVFQDVLASIGVEKEPLSLYFVQETFKDEILDRYGISEDFRSFVLPNEKKIFIFDNPVETYESLIWSMIKEISHYLIRKDNTLSRLCHLVANKEPVNVGFYEKLPDNDLCQKLATAYVGVDYSVKVPNQFLKR